MSTSMFANNSISIPVSDEDSDELARMRVRAKKKRKKHGFRVKNEFPRRLVKFLVRYWTLLIFFPAVGLVLFEVSRLGRRPSLAVRNGVGSLEKQGVEVKLEHLSINKTSSETKSGGNLNRLDPVTHVVHGVRERKWLRFCISNHLKFLIKRKCIVPLYGVLHSD